MVYSSLLLERINTNEYNKFENKLIKIKDYNVSIQANSSYNCEPKENYGNPYVYSKYEIIIFTENKVFIPMGYKKWFNKKGQGALVPLNIIDKIVKYIASPIGIMMEVECHCH